MRKFGMSLDVFLDYAYKFGMFLAYISFTVLAAFFTVLAVALVLGTVLP